MGTSLELLIVADNDDDGDRIVDALRRGGYDPHWTCVNDSTGAVSALSEQPWEIILCDYALPEFPAFKALQLIRSVYRLDTPVIIISGAIDDEVALELSKCGAQDYVEKGNDLRLVHAVRRALDDARAVRERQELDTLLNQERDLLDILMSNIPDAIYFKDRNFRHTRVNEMACRVLGKSTAAELLGKTADSMVPPDRAQRIRQEEENIFRTGEAIVNRIERVDMPDGTARWYSATKAPIRVRDGEIVGLVGITRDITERMLEERKHRHTEELTREILRVAPDAIIAVDGDQKIILFNESAKRVFGYGPGEMIGQPLKALLPKRSTAKHHELVDEFTRSADTTRNLDERKQMFGRRKNGEEFPAETAVSTFTLDEEITAVAIVRDISVRQAMIAENERLEKSLRHAEKMQSLGTLAGGIAHEFNNFLTPIQLLAEMVQDDLPDDQGLREDLQTILINCQRASELVDRILTFSRTDNGRKRTRIRLRNVVDETVSLLRKTLPASIRVHRELEEFEDWLFADESQLQQVIMNLAANAAHAMGGNVGTLTLALHRRGKRQRNGRGGTAVLTVRDTGCGMDDETAKRIFDPFFTTKSAGEGTGMGLAISHGIVVAHGGHMRVESVPGEGTTFHVYLPLSTSPNLNEVDRAMRH